MKSSVKVTAIDNKDIFIVMMSSIKFHVDYKHIHILHLIVPSIKATNADEKDVMVSSIKATIADQNGVMVPSVKSTTADYKDRPYLERHLKRPSKSPRSTTRMSSASWCHP